MVDGLYVIELTIKYTDVRFEVDLRFENWYTHMFGEVNFTWHEQVMDNIMQPLHWCTCTHDNKVCPTGVLFT